jgi:large subunit ribosomal protein L6
MEKTIISRLGKRPLPIPQGVTLEVNGNIVKVKGPKGELQDKMPDTVNVKVEDGVVLVESDGSKMFRKSQSKQLRANHGLAWALIRNMLVGVSEGHKKELVIEGVGYRAQMQGGKLTLNVGYSNPMVVEPPEGITIEVPEPTKVVVKGVNKYMVGQVAANIRKIRKPNVYSGAGIRYIDEVVRRKEGKKS